ncbi:MAG: GGDEF domain-containing protein [Chloroflexi bacterium]|nr:GGDEF domain-containing protein [Chloroflexota bacterium]NOG65889.1 GGDEF domain-containing protein [Chloroflexota bacterium]
MTRPRGEKDSFFDLLTGLPNRWRFEKRLQQIILRAEAREHGVGLVLMDLTGLKRINSTLGHTAGDAMVREVAEIIKAHAPPGALMGRLDGDEFGILLTDLGGEVVATSMTWAEGLLAAIQRLELVFEDRRVRIGANMGMSFCPLDADNGPELFQQAYLALQAAKKAGSNTLRRFVPVMQTAAWDDFEI